MAYRRKHSGGRTWQNDLSAPPEENSSSSSASSLAAQAIRASSAHKDSSLSSAYGESALHSAYRQRLSPSRQEGMTYEYTSMKTLNESKYGFWGVLARKAKSVFEEDNMVQQSETSSKTSPQVHDAAVGYQVRHSYQPMEGHRRPENPTIQKGLDALASSINYIGGTIGNALEEGLTIVENKAADIIADTRKLHNRKKGTTADAPNQAQHWERADASSPHNPQMPTDHETQLKASRDVAMAMAAKAKLLLRELKTVKADLAFAKERCAQLEEENRILRECHENGDGPEDDDLIRLQLETLLNEKARLAHENSVYARENRFLREIVEYHQLTMQDLVYLDEGIEEVTQVTPIPMGTPEPLPPLPPPQVPMGPPQDSPSHSNPKPSPTTPPPPPPPPSI
ncbi:uncharacterized protein LOC18432423 [Amborella trichopoda]|uniref:Uncharacterized protein n=1 Tax=Amborella trichopoda TaxID=13333 RepID=W1P346_AMBTC|nr:uncharacterized protein LOC18432423 [Amborella trichopoda]ERN04267.1 hypothetical protein AMTR_s00077p00164670 [Amborella trichopoda]|eukprot:XP_006842592.1 uncharacterized protein LOC18432423 [Amborella trichopoda]